MYVCMYVCVCMCVCIYVCMCVYTPLGRCVGVHVCVAMLYVHHYMHDACDTGRLEHNGFYATEWAQCPGCPGPLPNSSDAVRAGVQRLLVQSLAPFLIVVEPNVFWSYAFFYDMESGYIPCPGNFTIPGTNRSQHIECGMPDQWYPEFSKPLGPPQGPAVCSGEHYTAWTRTFKFARVSLDLRDIRTCAIEWSDEPLF